MIELYIENKKIDITDDLEINFTYESIDPDKLSSIKNSFSKTVNIPGTSNNNIVFGHIFRYDKYIPIAGPSNIESFYDPHKKVEWFINNNGNLVNRGYCTLDNIIVKGEVDITYQLTLYGGIGEFFYSLSYNSDGSEKTLKDLYWNWYPKVSLIGHDFFPTTPSDENSRILYKCSSDIVASSYHSLNPYNTYTGTTDIEKDVVFVPSYVGLYDNFDSKHMIVSTFNQYFNTTPDVLSDDTKAKLNESFPDSIEEFIDSGQDPDDPSDDNYKTYSTLGENLSSTDSYRFGLATFSRDLEPWEAGDIRVGEMPVAIRLSKLMNVISQSQNNGGYEVIWDDDILNSYQWLYSWVLLGKLKQTIEDYKLLTITPSVYDGQKTTINVNYTNGQGQLITNATTYDIPIDNTSLDQGGYKLSINVIPKLEFKCDSFNYWKDRTNGYISGSMYDNLASSYRYIWTTPVLIHKIYSGTTLIKTVADIFYFSSNPNYKFGYTKLNVSTTYIKDKLQEKIVSRFMGSGENIDEFNYHNCKLENPEVIGEGYINTVKFSCLNTRIDINLNLSSNISNLKISQSQGIMWTDARNVGGSLNISSGLYGTDSINFNVITNGSSNGPSGNPISEEAPYGFINGDYHTIWPYNEFSIQSEQNYSSSYFNINENLSNGIFDFNSSGNKVIDIDKELLLGSTNSPMKYLTDFCKLMNFRFICDDTKKKIYIKTLKNYYIDNVINLDNRVDLEEIIINNTNNSNKIINIDLNTPETYPVYLFNRKSKYKFNKYKYDTGLEYTASETNLFNNLVYDNIIDYRLSSIYYKNYSQISKPYNSNSISWTLFNFNNNSLETKEYITPGAPINNRNSVLENLDYFPKLSLFNRENKYVNINSSLIYLNGFVKNYNYSPINNTITLDLEPDEIIDNSYLDEDGNIHTDNDRCIYVYQNINSSFVYSVSASYNTSYPDEYLVMGYNENDNITYRGFNLGNINTYVSEVIHSSTSVKFMCNFLKSDTTKKLTVTTEDYYSISPKVCFSNDTYTQYLLNGKRCYIYDFKYNSEFTSWGYWDYSNRGTSGSWVLPIFSRDLYNLYSVQNDEWYFSGNLEASWNLNDQDGLENLYLVNNTAFIKNPNFKYSKFAYNINLVNSNLYSIDSLPINNDTRIYNLYWKDYLDDIYDRNTRDITAYVDLTGLGDANMIMRNIYSWKSNLWIITKLENFKISNTTNNKFTKVRLHKIKDKNTWVNGE